MVSGQGGFLVGVDVWSEVLSAKRGSVRILLQSILVCLNYGFSSSFKSGIFEFLIPINNRKCAHFALGKTGKVQCRMSQRSVNTKDRREEIHVTSE